MRSIRAGALHPRITQAVEGCRKLLVTTPTAIALSRLLSAVCPDAESAYLS